MTGKRARQTSLVLALSLAFAGSAFPHVGRDVVAAAPDGKTAMAFLCRPGGFAVVVTRDADGKGWLGNDVHAIEESDPVRWRVVGEDAVDTYWRRAGGIPETWLIPNPRSWTARLLRYDLRTRVRFEVWLPGDDRSKPGRVLDLHGDQKLARAWLLVREC